MESNEYIVFLREFNLITAEAFVKALKDFGTQAREEKLSTSLTETLQKFDIITQRLQHLIDTHEKVMTLYIDDIFKESFLHLQYFQFSIIAFDLFEVLPFINAGMHNVLGSCGTGNQNNQTAGTQIPSRFRELSEKIKSSIKANAGESRFLKVPPLTKRQISICRGLYTMDCERIVLDWFVNNAKGKLSELLETYQSWQLNYKDPSIELFDNV